MKMSKLICFMLALLLIVGSVSAVSALASPYSKNFDNKADMLDALSVYADTFPNVDDYTYRELAGTPQGCHLEHKEIIIPEFKSTLYSSDGYSYAEAIYGGGVNYTFSSFRAEDESGTIRFLVYYHMNREIITRNLNSLGSDAEDAKHYSGEIGGYSYTACETADSSGVVTRCDYNIAVGERLVVIYTEEAFSEDFLNSIQFETTGIMLPVYVQDSTDTEVSSDDEITAVLPEVQEGYNRYFFLMPDDWYNEYTDTAGIYWWEGAEAHSSWPGVKANKADAENVYYYDVPKDVTTIIWNNYMNLLLEDDHYWAERQTMRIPLDLPDGQDTMIYVVDPARSVEDLYKSSISYEGNWYYYYGNGYYGTDTDPNYSKFYGDIFDTFKNMTDEETVSVYLYLDKKGKYDYECPEEELEAFYNNRVADNKAFIERYSGVTEDEILFLSKYEREIAVVVNKAELVRIWNDSEVKSICDYDLNYTLENNMTGTEIRHVFADYLAGIGYRFDDCSYHIVKSGESKGNTVIFTRIFPLADEVLPVRIGNYIFTAHSCSLYYDLGIYVIVDDDVMTLEEAYEKKLIDLEEVAEFYGSAELIENLGDMDLNGKVNVKDATLLQKGIAGLVEMPKVTMYFDYQEIDVTDFNGDGELNIRDATAIQKKIAGLI